MITVEEACKIVMNKANAPYIAGIRDVGRGYVVAFAYNKHDILVTAPIFVDKETGSVSAYLVPEHLEEYANGKSEKVPDEYWFGGTID